MNDLSAIWSEFKDLCKNELIPRQIIDHMTYDTFIDPSYLQSLENNKAIIITSSEFHKMALDGLKDQFEILLHKITSQNYTIEFYSSEGYLKLKDKYKKEENFDLEIIDHLNSNYTFDNFVVGSSNRIAQAAAKGAALNPGESFNPLFIYGNSGLGKTHLLNSIGNYAKQKYPDMTILCTPCNTFINEYVDSIKNGDIDLFTYKYHHIDLFLIDDIQFLAGKDKTSEVFFHIFNHMINHHKQIVVTSDKLPKELSGLENRLISRFNSGLSVGIDNLEFETALAIVKKKMEVYNVNAIPIDEDVLHLIANKFSTDVRELEGSLNTLLFNAIMLNKNRIDMNTAIEAFKDKITLSNSHDKLTANDIKKAVAHYYNLSLSQLTSKTRTSNIALARHTAMYLIRELLDISFVEIGHEFGGRDHSTVMKACDKVKQSLKKDKNYQVAIKELKKILQE